ncbi:hypothetical protein Gogos_004928 [Gossypium gossypioides]|uniref:Uncharacterized protein n=1 Tax=Gossypium gossypioides TaxID=34282 RepID=A0A7J9CIG3_GOSGO|nr:hypothetical protein [Gossypium gossypioides]
MAVDLEPKATLSWKDKIVGGLAGGARASEAHSGFGVDEEIKLLDGDITRSMVNGVLRLNFLKELINCRFKTWPPRWSSM